VFVFIPIVYPKIEKIIMLSKQQVYFICNLRVEEANYHIKVDRFFDAGSKLRP